MTNNQKFLRKVNLEADKQLIEHYESKPNVILSETDIFLMGANFVLQLFNQYSISSDRNEALKQKEGETNEQYEYRLRDELVEHMVSNRGYASCLSDN